MARWLLPAIAFVMLAGCAKEEASPAPTYKLTTAEQAIVGDWLAQTVWTDESIESYHRTYPEGDLEAVRRLHELWASRPLMVLRVNADGSAQMLTTTGLQSGPGCKWRLSPDESKLILSYESEVIESTGQIVDGKPVERESSSMKRNDMIYTVAGDRKSFSDERGELTFFKRGSAEEKAAFEETSEALASLDLAENVTPADFVGKWRTSPGDRTDPRDPFRASVGEAEYEKTRAQVVDLVLTLEIKPDVSFETSVKGVVVGKGTWQFVPERNAVVISIDSAAVDDPFAGFQYELRLSDDKATVYSFVAGDEWGQITTATRVKPKA